MLEEKNMTQPQLVSVKNLEKKEELKAEKIVSSEKEKTPSKDIEQKDLLNSLFELLTAETMHMISFFDLEDNELKMLLDFFNFHFYKRSVEFEKIINNEEEKLKEKILSFFDEEFLFFKAFADINEYGLKESTVIYFREKITFIIHLNKSNVV